MNKTHYCPVGHMKESYCLCGNEDPQAMVATDLGGVDCDACIKVARNISMEVANLFAFYKTTSMSMRISSSLCSVCGKENGDL